MRLFSSVFAFFLFMMMMSLEALAQVPAEVTNAPDLKAFPDADGIVLVQEVEIVLDREGKVTRRVRTLTKVLRENMMRSRRCDPHIPYDSTTQKFTPVRCRAWMRDGKAVDTDPAVGFVEITPFALEHAVDYTGLRQMVMVHTGVEHGASLDLEYTIEDTKPSGNPFWGEVSLQGDLPILDQTVVLRVPEGTHLTVEGFNFEVKPEKKSAEGVDVYTVHRSNVPAVNLEECSHRDREITARLIYTTVPSWAEVGTYLDKWVSRSVDTSDEIKERVKALTAGAGTKLERAYRIHDFVSTRVRTVNWPLQDFGFRPRPASRVQVSAYGHALDKAVLLKAMLKEAGISSSVVMASRTSTLAARAASPTQISDVWVALDNGEHRVWLDPLAPLSKRSSRHLEGRTILCLAGRGSALKRVPVRDPAETMAVMTGQCTVGEDLGMAAEIRLDLAGNQNPYHGLYGGEGPLRAFCARVANAFGGGQAETYNLRHLDETLSSFCLRISGGKARQVAGRGTVEIRLPDLPDPVAGREYQIYRNRRSTPLFLAGVAFEKVDITIRLPAGYTVTYLPQAVALETPLGDLKMAFTLSNGKLTYRKSFSLKKSVVSPEAYANFRTLITAQRARRNTILLLQRAED